jgi:hypothetical protein
MASCDISREIQILEGLSVDELTADASACLKGAASGHGNFGCSMHAIWLHLMSERTAQPAYKDEMRQRNQSRITCMPADADRHSVGTESFADKGKSGV